MKQLQSNTSGKRNICRHIFTVLTGLTLTLALLATRQCAAQSYYVPGMHDFDQRSAYFPNGGNAYCVPTALTDELFYLAQNGYPKVVENNPWFPNDPWSPNNEIVNMGLLLKTNPAKGSFFDTTVVEDYINTSYPDAFTVWTIRLFWNVQTISKTSLYNALHHSNMVMLSYGMYTPPEPTIGFRDILAAHFVVLNGVDLQASTISTRDPWVDEIQDPFTFLPNFTSQSPYHDNVWSVKLDQTPYVYGPRKGRLETVTDYLTTVNKKCGDWLDTLVDGVSAIQPKEFVTVLDNLTVQYYNPYVLQTTQVAKSAQFYAPVGRTVLDADFYPTMPQAAVVLEGSDQIMQVDLTTGRWSELSRGNKPRQALYGGRGQNLYVRDAEGIKVLDMQGETIAQATPRQPVDAIGFDESSQSLVAVSLKARQISFYSADLQFVGSVPLPTIEGTGELTLSVQPRTGTVWLHRDGSTNIAGVGYDTRTGGPLYQTIQLERAVSPRGLYISGSGRIYVSDGGVVAEYDPTGRRTHLTKYDGLPAGRILKMTRSFSNVAPESMTRARVQQIVPSTPK